MNASIGLLTYLSYTLWRAAILRYGRIYEGGPEARPAERLHGSYTK
ncbi:MAG: hypothetical protein ABSH32_11465 [Bryobacteraceae bacterium]|jgi:hypothetical protein